MKVVRFNTCELWSRNMLCWQTCAAPILSYMACSVSPLAEWHPSILPDSSATIPAWHLWSHLSLQQGLVWDRPSSAFGNRNLLQLHISFATRCVKLLVSKKTWTIKVIIILPKTFRNAAKKYHKRLALGLFVAPKNFPSFSHHRHKRFKTTPTPKKGIASLPPMIMATNGKTIHQCPLCSTFHFH